jgi:hypothetical protein
VPISPERPIRQSNGEAEKRLGALRPEVKHHIALGVRLSIGFVSEGTVRLLARVPEIQLMLDIPKTAAIGAVASFLLALVKTAGYCEACRGWVMPARSSKEWVPAI